MLSNFFKNKTLELQNKIMAEALQKAQDEAKRMREAYETQLSANYKSTYGSEFALDYCQMNAFSIERLCRDGQAVTVIGYFLNNQVREWNLYCNEERHQELVNQFKLYLEKKNTPSNTIYTIGGTTTGISTNG